MRHKAVMLAGLIALGIATGMTIGCGGGGNSAPATQTRQTLDALYGTWRLTSVTGGISGGGQPVLKDTRIVFDRNGQFRRYEDGTLVFEDLYRVARVSRLLNLDGNSVIDFDSEARDAALPLIIAQLSETHLTLTEESNDGYQYEYERFP